jgi:hypothetical protein
MADGGQNTNGLPLPRPKRAFGRSLADFRLKDATTPNGLHPAEERLLDCVRRGIECRIASVRPEKATPENTIRGSFLRFLLLGGDEVTPVHEKGVILHGAYIEGSIDLESAKDVRSLWFWRCHIGQIINGRNASFDDITLQDCLLGRLNFASASIAGDVVLGESQAEGEVNFAGSDIGDSLNCYGAKLKNAGGMALVCDGAKVTGDVFLNGGFYAEGVVRFPGAEIGGYLDCSGAKLKNAGGVALVGDCAKVTGSVFLGVGFEVEGGVRFVGAEIGGDLDCSGATLKNAGGMALFCDGAKVTGSVFLNGGFEAEGEARFAGAEIGSDLACMGGVFKNAKAANLADKAESPRAANALSLSSAKIGGVLWLGPAAPPNDQNVTLEGSLDLQGAHAHELVDDPKLWSIAEVATEQGKLPCHIHLDGFTYDRFASGAKTDWKTRKVWLERQLPKNLGKDFRPQPFEQLIKVLREMGHDADARRIGFLKQAKMRPWRWKRAPRLSRPFVWLTDWAFGISCGYGYRPHRLIVALLALWFVCGSLYQAGAGAGGFAPKDAQVWTNPLYKDCVENWADCRKGAGHIGEVKEIIAFEPFLYSADMMLPAIDLGQRSVWTPRMRKIEIQGPFVGKRMTLPPATLRTVAWAENILGVAGVILIGAILSGIVKRD